MTRALMRAGGVFAALHDALMGGAVDMSGLDVSRYPRERLELAQRTWQSRVRSEFRSIQIMTRLLTEVLGAGDPLDVYAGALELVEDEIKHTALCAAVCEALGVPATMPDPVRLDDPEPYLRSPMAERALATAISMLAINETISVGFVSDLQSRCDNPPIRRVLDATVEDEGEHQQFGWAYVRQALARFPIATLPDWRHLVKTTLAPHEEQAQRVLAPLPAQKQRLEAWPEQELAELGLFGPERQALVYRSTMEREVVPKLRDLGLY